MTVLQFDGVSKHARHGKARSLVIAEAAFEIAVGELVCIQGRRRSGRTTLVHLACGLTRPDTGRVLLAGHDLAHHDAVGRDVTIAHPRFERAHGRSVVEHVAFPLRLQGRRGDARKVALRALADIGCPGLAEMHPAECQPHELLLAAIARAIVTSPRLVLLDEPVTGASAAFTEQVLELLRAFALNGTAVMFTAEEMMVGVDRTLTIDQGRVRGATGSSWGEVVPLRGCAS